MSMLTRRPDDALDHRVAGRKRRFVEAIGGAEAPNGRLGLVRARAHGRARAARRGRPRRRSGRVRSDRPPGRSRRRRATGRRRARPPRARPRARRCSSTKPRVSGVASTSDRRLRQTRVRARDEILRAAERGDHALEPLRRRAALERAPQRRGARIHVVREAREREQFGAERDRHPVKARVAPRAGQIVDGVADLDRVAGGAGERLVHVGDERDGRQAGVVGDRRDAGRELARSIAASP